MRLIYIRSELMALLAANDNLELIKNRYQHLVICQHCEHLAVNAKCKTCGVKMYPNAMRDCASFKKVEGDRLPIVHVPYTYTQSELNEPLLNREQTKSRVFKNIAVDYNNQRRHSYTNYLSPADCKKQQKFA